jgi:broad specificity phosphatase PhoE
MSNLLIRHVSPKYSGNLYEDYLLGGLMQRDFSLSDSGKEIVLTSLNKLRDTGCQKIFYSPATICKEMAQMISNGLKIEMFELSDLKMVKHDFSQFTNPALWVNGKSPDDSEMKWLRQNSIIHFLQDRLLESKQDIIDRFNSLKNKLDVEKAGLFISHGYTIKLFSLYLRTEFSVSQQEILELAETEKSFGESLQGFEYPSLSLVQF